MAVSHIIINFNPMQRNQQVTLGNLNEGKNGVGYKGALNHFGEGNKGDDYNGHHDNDAKISDQNSGKGVSLEGRKCGRFQWTKKKLFIIITLSILTVSAIVIPLSIMLGPQLDQNYYSTVLTHNKSSLLSIQGTYSHADNIGYTTLQSLGSKIESTQPFSQTSFSCEEKGEGEGKGEGGNKEMVCEIVVPVIGLLRELQGLEVQSRGDWWRQGDWGALLDKFLAAVGDGVAKVEEGDREKIQILGIQKKTLIDIFYNQDKQAFEVAKFDKTQQETNTESEPNANPEPNTTETQIDSTLKKASRYLKSLIARNLRMLQTHSKQILQQSRKFLKKEEIPFEEWQQVLIDSCRAISVDLFRCSRQAVGKFGLGNGDGAGVGDGDGGSGQAVVMKVRLSDI